MSEGPEVRRVAQELNRELSGQTIREVEAHHKAIRAVLDEQPDAILGRRIECVYPIGKHILFELDNGSHLHNHLLMFGSWRIYGLRAKIPIDPRTMEIVRTEKTRAVLRGGSVFELLAAGELVKHKSISKLGPDVLGESLDAEQVVANFEKHPALEIGVALLMQELLAGVGNYLKSEILYVARVNPRRRINELSRSQLREIVRRAREVTLYSFEHSGYTVPDDIKARANEPGMSPLTVGRKHWVFRRTRKPCYTCGTPIRQFRQGEGRGRITYVCPTCQHMEA